MITLEALTVADLVGDIEREIAVLRAIAADYRRDEERYAGQNYGHRLNGMARACEVEVDRLAAIVARYQGVTA